MIQILVNEDADIKTKGNMKGKTLLKFYLCKLI